MIKRSHLLFAGFVLIVLTNAVALLGAAYNRSDEPESQLRLTQRELQKYRWSNKKDNSGITLNLNWRIAREITTQEFDYGVGYSAARWGNPVWLNKAKLKELGFDVDKISLTSANRRRYKELKSGVAMLVLELNGSAYQQELQRAKDYAEQARSLHSKNPDHKDLERKAKNAEDVYQQEQLKNSRLFVIDAGIDLQKLRAAYPDRTRYTIVNGLIHPNVMYQKNKNEITGNISALHAEKINVPLVYRKVFETEEPFEVTVAFGKRLEPWITSASISKIEK